MITQYNTFINENVDVNLTTLKVGDMISLCSTGLKCESGFKLALKELYEDKTDGVKIHNTLCKIEQVEKVSVKEFDETNVKFGEGGCATDDDVVADKLKNNEPLTPSDKKKIYTLVTMVTDGKRYYFIDSEGYDYTRYIYFTDDFEDMFKKEIAVIENENNGRREKEDNHIKSIIDNVRKEFPFIFDKSLTRNNKIKKLLQQKFPDNKFIIRGNVVSTDANIEDVEKYFDLLNSWNDKYSYREYTHSRTNYGESVVHRIVVDNVFNSDENTWNNENFNDLRIKSL